MTSRAMFDEDIYSIAQSRGARLHPYYGRAGSRPIVEVLCLGAVLSMHCLEQPLRRNRELRHSHTHSIENRIRYRCTNWYYRRFAYTLRSKGAEARGNLNKNRSNMRNIHTMGQCIIHQISSQQLPILIIYKAFVERPTKPLRHTA